MTGQHQARPLYLDTERGPVFGLLHPAGTDAPSGAGVLIVGPWGWDDVVTYRSRRDWAEDLAGRGHAVLRIDLPGSGDSSGSPSDDDLVAAWSGAIGAAALFLRHQPGCRRVAVIGLGLGGLAVARAIHDGAAVDELILWAAPATGRAFLREMRAFSGLQSARFSLSGEPEPQLLPDGWLEIGGFVLSTRTMAALETLDPTAFSFEGLKRALLLDRDGLPADHALRARLEGAGVHVVAGSGAGWSAMCADIERHRPPTEVFATVGAFLAAAHDDAPIPAPGPDATDAATPAPTAAPPPTVAPIAAPAATIRVGSATLRESTVAIAQPAGQIFGVLTEPDTGTRSELCAVFLNAGAVRRIGPNRMWVEAARRWAARGVPSLRLDIEAIGDADGDPTAFADVNAFYRADLAGQVSAAIDLLESRGLGDRFLLVGLCSGAYWAFRVALIDGRVASVALLNPRCLIWDPHVFARLAAEHDARKVLHRDAWGRFLRGQIGPRRIAEVARSVLGGVADGLRGRAARLFAPEDSVPAETDDGLLGSLDRRGTRVVLAFSDEEPLRTHLEDEKLPARFRRWPNAAWVSLPGRDHTVRPIVAQAAVHALLDKMLDRELAKPAVASDPARAPRAAQPPSFVP